MANKFELLDVADVTERPNLPAGEFGPWLLEFVNALTTDGGIDVPCGDCTACCRASQFIHVGAQELETLARIPEALLFPAPGRPKGDVIMGYDEDGRCPMLVDGRCSIYAHRPVACRNYDCRMFAATRISPDDDEVAKRAASWCFASSDENSADRHMAIQHAAEFLIEHSEDFGEAMPRNPTQLAALAISVHQLFRPSEVEDVESVRKAILGIIERSEKRTRG